MGKGLERRDFLKVLGVSGAGATLFGCSSSTPEKLIPYVIQPEEIVPGTSTWYRTTCRECPAGCGMDVRTREGRATKVEGNPLSPISHGRLCARGQAALHGLYNPDRIPQPLRRNGAAWDKLTWDQAEEELTRVLGQRRGTGVFLTGREGGSLDRLIDELCTAYDIERVRYEPFGYEPIRAAYRLLFGRDAVPVHDFAAAEVVVTFGADFLETWVSPIDYAHRHIQAHAYDRGLHGRLISVAPHQSLTDMNADEWLPIRPGTEHRVALAMARIIADDGRGQSGVATDLLQSIDVGAVAQAAGISEERLRQVARAFGNGGRSLAVGPGVASTHGAATATAAAVAILNLVAGNLGRTVQLGHDEQPGAGLASYADMQELLERMRNTHVGLLLVHGPNPLYSLPGRQQVEEALGRVPMVVSFANALDDTSARAHLLLPDHHFLEAWGDYQPRTGVHAIVQPVMMPVFNTKQTGDVLLAVARRGDTPLPTSATTFYDYLRESWQQDLYPAAAATGAPDFEEWWRQVRETGGIVAETQPPPPPALDADGLAQIPFDAAVSYSGDDDDPYLVVYPSYKYYDGRGANRLWLQELPDPISKFTWSSCVELHPDTADRLGLDTGHLVEVTTSAGTARLPVWRHPGTRPDVIAIQLGQGHEEYGTYARERGVNPVRLLTPQAEDISGALVWQQTRAHITPTGKWERPAQSSLHEDQHDRDVARAIALGDARREDLSRGFLLAAAATPPAEPQAAAGPGRPEPHPFDEQVTELQADAGFRPQTMDAAPQGFPPPGTLYGEYDEDQPRWGMSIDLDRCIGCSACVTACYAENNIGVVGPELVAQGRIMHWMRIERYYEGENDGLTTRFLPMLCQHCSNAPCEPVCPVYAAYHTPDGLNAQVYNRCVGTRYCANNCPYKVRVFNWFSWEWPEPLNWQLNPDVTVREKGVMEKCTLCVQRIREQQNEARIQNRAVTDGEITPACAQTCPGEAIVFGNLKDPNARVTRIAASGRGYRVLDELNTQSAIIYLKRVVPEAAEG